MNETPQQKNIDLARVYGTNWTKTNVSTLFEWMSIAAFNIRCLEIASKHYRSIIRNHTIFGLVLSTLSGTISVSTFGLETDPIASNVLKGIFAFFSFAIAVYTGYIKVYQIQERLEQFIRIKQDWTVFSTSLASELQLPIELRRDALWLIIKNKNVYLDLLKIDVEIPEKIKKIAENELPHPKDLHLDVSTLPRIIMDIGSQELNDLSSTNMRNKDRFSKPPTTMMEMPSREKNDSPQSITLNVMA